MTKKEIKQKAKQLRKAFKTIVTYIEKYDTIVIMGHINNDLDSLGSQFGLKRWIEVHYPNKQVYAIGTNNIKYNGKFAPLFDEVENIEEDFLAIAVDVNNLPRIDGKELFAKAKEKICIDHHYYFKEPEFDYYYIDPVRPACSEILGSMFYYHNKKQLDTQVAKYLYTGIISDTGNFYFEAVDCYTFFVACKLIEFGDFNPYRDVNLPVMQKSLSELKLLSALIEEIKYENGFAYYQIDIEKQKQLNITGDDVTDKIFEFNDIEEFEIIASFSELEKGIYKCSLRSKHISIVEVATKYGGGGHKLAAGARNLTLENIESMKKDLKSLLNNEK